MAAGNCLVVAAIDFGTTYSGCAFSFKHDFDKDPTKICTMKWSGSQLTTLKGPTCVLIKPDGKTLAMFGYGAEVRYSELSETGEHRDWFFFRRFKMMLWNKPIHKDTMLDDECGKSLPALRVFSLAIRYMMDCIINLCQEQVVGLKPDDIHWVLTVPAIWNDAAKHFMRLAAQDAGISAEKLTISLEPEAASIYCRHIPVQKDDGINVSVFQPGEKYLVLDAGGGTIDITVHEVCFGGRLKELYKATGGAWGGTMVDNAFLDFMELLIGKDILKQFKNKYMEDYIELLRTFETKKRETNLKSGGRVTLRLPVTISELVHDINGQKLKDTINASPHSSDVALAGDKLRLNMDIFRSFFKGSVDSILQHVSALLLKPEALGVQAILMVGGYSESPLLQEAIQKEFPTMTIIIPHDAAIAVLKGAVIFGHSPTTINERVSKYTYGTDYSVPFDKRKHPSSKQKWYDTGDRCDDIFSFLIKAGQTLVVGEKHNAGTFYSLNKSQSSMEFKLFCTPNQEVKFVTDFGCKQIGSFDVPLSGKGLKRCVIVRIMFGGTEITVECEEETTGHITNLSVDFLQ